MSDVAAPAVQAGVSTAEFRAGVSLEDGKDRLRTRVHLDHAVNDWYAFRLVLMQDKQHHHEYEHQATAFENRIQLFSRDRHGLDAGFRLIYNKSHSHNPDMAVLALVSQAPVGQKLEWRSNLILGHTVGAASGYTGRGITVEIRNQLAYQYKDMLFGIDMYNDFGHLHHSPQQKNGWSQQDHDIGPFVRGNIGDNAYYHFGYVRGISSAASDHGFKFFLGTHF